MTIDPIIRKGILEAEKLVRLKGTSTDSRPKLKAAIREYLEESRPELVDGMKLLGPELTISEVINAERRASRNKTKEFEKLQAQRPEGFMSGLPTLEEAKTIWLAVPTGYGPIDKLYIDCTVAEVEAAGLNYEESEAQSAQRKRFCFAGVEHARQLGFEDDATMQSLYAA